MSTNATMDAPSGVRPGGLTPREVVEALDKYIVGQGKAKRAVAIALRNRYRRMRVRPDLRDEITPKNILMIGPTGVGKTEIARRLAGLVGAPFVKVEATKYTEVGYVGRDVESMIRDLVESAIRTVTEERRGEVRDVAEKQAVERIIDALYPQTRAPHAQSGNPFAQTLGSIFGNNYTPPPQPPPAPAVPPSESAKIRDAARAEIERGFYDVRLIEIDVEEAPTIPMGAMGPGMDRMTGGADFGEMLGGILPKKKSRKRVTVPEARRIFAQEEAGNSSTWTPSSAKRSGARPKTASSSSTRSTKLPGAGTDAADRTFRAKACSATSCRSSRARRFRPSTGKSRPTTSYSSRPARFTSASRRI